ncbi:isovaleryl CoA dehydrogenase [Thermoplasmatales archaeon]|nr:isovaleryl CoA dehydrogenase [Thermoplasmatales archaeon]
MKKTAFSSLSNIFGKNHYEIDLPLHEFARYFNQNFSCFSALGEYAGSDLYEIADYVDKHARPEHVVWDINGNRTDAVLLDPAERYALMHLVRDFGINRFPYEEGSWHKHFAGIYLISDPGIACVLTVTNQTAYALFKYGSKEQKRLIPALTGSVADEKYGATWFTEIQGGSDLGANTVRADNREGRWVLNGDTKYFASDAGLADYAIVSARFNSSTSGAKGLGLFLIPEFRKSGERNFEVRRLKDKSATASVPTGEVIFRDTEAETVGELSKGIYYIMENLMISRLSNAFGALGVARKAYLEAYYYSTLRSTFGKKLIDHPLVIRDLLDMEIYIEGTMILALKAVDEFQNSYTDTPPYTQGYHYARMLTHLAKNLTADMASYVTEMAMQLHGGIGFLREFPIERLHREALITPIWEGPSNIQAIDMLESMAKKGAHLTLIADLESMSLRIKHGKDMLDACLSSIKNTSNSLSKMDEANVQFFAKDTLNSIGHATAVVLLLDASDKLGSDRIFRVAELYYRRFVAKLDYKTGTLTTHGDLIGIGPSD